MQLKYFIILFLLLLTVHPVSSQISSDFISVSVTNEPVFDSVKYKANIFKYNKTDKPVVFDFSFGLGIMETGLQLGPMFNIDIYHVLLGCHINENGLTIVGAIETLNQSSFLLGYRYRSNHVMVALASGLGRQEYICTSDMDEDCYNYRVRHYKTVPLILEFDWILDKNFSVGVNFNKMFSNVQNVDGAMICLKLGNFRKK